MCKIVEKNECMENKVYYGEYSLKHWIDLMLKGNIELPPYQRYFVWSEDKVRFLIDTFKQKRFVPPITIGAFKIDNENKNFIIDGQQRLTSILLAYLGLFPNTDIYKKTVKQFANDGSKGGTHEDKLQLDNIIDWTFLNLAILWNNKKEKLEGFIDGNYKIINYEIDDDFFEKTFLGFSYLVPSVADEKQQLKFYTSVFRNINNQGEPLKPLESRKSLYFLDSKLSQFFAPEFCDNIKIKIFNEELKLDFVRYLSLLSQFKKDPKIYFVELYYKRSTENFYEEYIYSIVGESKSDMFDDFTTIFPNNDFESRFNALEETITSLDIFSKQFTSIIDLDIYFFGLIYFTIFEHKQIDISKKENLLQELSIAIEIYKKDVSHKRSPGAFKYLRSRINDSIEIYSNYAI